MKQPPCQPAQPGAPRAVAFGHCGLLDTHQKDAHPPGRVVGDAIPHCRQGTQGRRQTHQSAAATGPLPPGVPASDSLGLTGSWAYACCRGSLVHHGATPRSPGGSLNETSTQLLRPDGRPCPIQALYSFACTPFSSASPAAPPAGGSILAVSVPPAGGLAGWQAAIGASARMRWQRSRRSGHIQRTTSHAAGAPGRQLPLPAASRLRCQTCTWHC